MSTTLVPASEHVDLTTMPRADLPVIWNGFLGQVQALKHTAETLTVTDPEDSVKIKLARATRLQLRQIRLALEAKRKELTDYHLKTKQEIDKCAKWLKEQIEPLEARLEDQEKISERMEAARQDQVRKQRIELLTPFGVDVSMYNLGEMNEKAFSDLYEVSKYSFEEAQAKEKREAEAREQLRFENERLRKEAEEARKEREALEAARLKEQQEAQAKLNLERQQAQAYHEAVAKEEQRKRDELEAKNRAEQQKREAAERELQAAKDKEKAASEAQQRALEKAQAAPDREKLITLAETVRTLPIPVATTQAGKIAFEQARQALEELAKEMILWM